MSTSSPFDISPGNPPAPGANSTDISPGNPPVSPPDSTERGQPAPSENQTTTFLVVGGLVVFVGCILCGGVGVGAWMLGRHMQDRQHAAARQQAQTLTKAVVAWKDRHNQWPERLDRLLQPDNMGLAILDGPDALRDPWGGQIHYDPSGPMNQGRIVDIWAVDPSDGSMWGNWPNRP